MDFKKRFALMEEYNDKLDLYFEIKAYLYDARMTDKYDERGEPIDFEKEIAKLDRKIAKLKPKADECKKIAGDMVREALEYVFGKSKSDVDG